MKAKNITGDKIFLLLIAFFVATIINIVAFIKF